ncbi:RHS repeat-associated core domain-containing protein [Pantoea agglomerans]|uniref:RHS repeat-associated core domain-containing protein n=1 Tax=Enterobacter agglomerans TaxID=549 RepID=UPI002413326F|nr:RHS repeat-associated core domain-containing protein [Pantoea agglomerans]
MNNVFTSHAGNFISAMQTRVDPRTGQFMVNLPLANLVGNNQLGPDLSLGLCYSPLVSSNAGFGTGFSLGITQFSNLTNLLELSNGEKYRIEPGTDTVRSQKLSNFRFAFTNGNDDADGYTVFWKEGKQELLTLNGDDTFVTSQITSPLGRTLTLDWDWSGQYPLLTQVSDETAALCQFSYDSTTVMTVWPGTEEEYQVTFALINDNQLDTVSRQVSQEESLDWSFSYDAVDGADHLLLTGVTYPTGMTDAVEYSQTDGLQYPDGSGISTRLPAVLSHTRSPGSDQPETVTYYAYTEQNFLGYNGDFGDWAADSDYLYTTLTDYVYGSTETVSAGDVTVSVDRAYNNYHLQLSEETTREGCAYRTDFTYYAEPDTFIDGQPPQFQLVKQKTDTWTDAQNNSRTQTTQTDFDESGNPTRQVAPDGTETVTTWYAPEGEEGCPAEPHGFVRFMKAHTVTPRKTDYDAPVMLTRYAFVTAGGEAHVVQDAMATYADGVLLQRRAFTYADTAGDAEYGRIISIADTKYDGGEEGESYVLRQDFATAVSGGVMSQTTTLTGYDGLQAASVRTLSALSGLPFSQTDAQGVTVTHTYDKLGRPLTRTLAPGTDYENISTWSYAIGEAGPVTTQSDASGNGRKLHFDGAGRNLRQAHLDTDDTQGWYEVSSRTYNAIGEATAGTGSDWLTGASEQYSVQVETGMDAWGNASRQVFSDGSVNQQNADPIALTRERSVHGGRDGQNLNSGVIKAAFDAKSYQLVTQKRTDSAGQDKGVRTFGWDGAGRLRQETDEQNNVTVRTYDAYGRVLTQTLPDGSTVTRTYAPHLTGDNVATISVTGPDAGGNVRTWPLGSQAFDSLGRVTKRVSGGRTTAYAYDGASPAPSEITLPSGKILQYAYIPELGNAVSSLTADGVTQTFTHDSLTADLLTASEEAAENDYVWTPSGNMQSETFSRDGESRLTEYTCTLGGQGTTYKDITGARTTFERDGYGQITALSDDALTISLQYDALGRLSTQTVKDAATAATLTTALSYDDFGQEITRTITGSDGVILQVMQAWLPNGLLQSRTTQQDGTTVKAETYDYDSRNRLTGYQASGSSLPPDGYGHKMTAQTYEYDALNNLTSVTTTLADGGSDTATYHYENAADPTQLTRVTHTHDDYPQSVALVYDANGYMTQDEAGRTLGYDIMGRLVSVSGGDISGGRYGYDALNRLVSQSVSDEDVRQLYYRRSELVNEVLTEQNTERRWIKSGHGTLGVQESNTLTLTAGDGNDSLQWSQSGNDAGKAHAWSPYGAGDAEDGLPGFNGERADPVSGTYHLGNGYRAYNPVLMRFSCPDSLSPFGAGGINPYAYCAGDPVNHTDPSGHLSWQGIAGIVAGTIGVALSVFTAGASIAAAGGVMAALGAASATSLVVGGLGVAADVTAIASGAVEESNPQASSVLGWVSMGLGLTGMGEGLTRIKRPHAGNAAESGEILRRRGPGNTVIGVDNSRSVVPESTPRAAGVGRREDISINLHPANAKPVQYYKMFYVEDIGLPGRTLNEHGASGFLSDVRGTGEPGVVIHGFANATLQMGETSGRMFWSMGDFYDYVKESFSIDLKTVGGADKPLHLLACYGGGRNMIAQKLANFLKRDVIGYGDNEIIVSGARSVLGNPESRIWSDNGEFELLPVVYHPLRKGRRV